MDLGGRAAAASSIELLRAAARQYERGSGNIAPVPHYVLVHLPQPAEQRPYERAA